jgi:long-chain acyl-CoA synthetase
MERQVGEFGALQIGFRLFFVESLATFSRDLQHARPTVFVSVPRLWEKFRQGVLDKISPEKLNRLLALPLIDTFVRRKIRKGLGLDAARALYNGGAALPTDIGAWFARVGSPILEGYGMTELGGATHLNPKGRNVFGSAGIPFPGVEQRIDSQTGELQVRSAANTPGYYRSPECEAELFTEDGWLRTGDKAYLDNEQRAYIVGRLKDNFKSSKGKFVTPAPIEMALGRHPACENCVVVGSGLPQPWGVMVLNETATLGLPQDRERLACSLEEHLTQVNKSLAPHERLDGIAVSACVWSIGNRLLTPTLKTRRKLVEERYLPVVSQFVGQQPRIHWID